MEKMIWEKPQMNEAVFAANEYVAAACYKIKCDTPTRDTFLGESDSWYYLYDDNNNDGTLDTGDSLLYSADWPGFSGCGKWHNGVMRDEAPQANGFVSTKKAGESNNTFASVFWWLEGLGSDSDYHVMTPGSENYLTNKNAS